MTQRSSEAKLLLLFAHPTLESSRVNRRLIAAAAKLPGVTLHDLYEVYPDFDVDVAREQCLLAEHDAVVLQYPLLWYSAPALVKQWLESVLEFGWAFGEGGEALAGKRFLQVVTAAGRESSYGRDGLHAHTIEELLAPLRQTVRMCGMECVAPFVLYGGGTVGEATLQTRVDEYVAALAAVRRPLDEEA